jgi:predicted RNase H-like HicB family nuclease
MSVIRVQAQIQWNASRDPASNFWVAVCEPLKLTAQGETWSILVESISDTLQIIFTDLVKTGTLERFIEAHGWKLQTPIPANTNRLRFDVPFELKRRNSRYVHRPEGALC